MGHWYAPLEAMSLGTCYINGLEMFLIQSPLKIANGVFHILHFSQKTDRKGPFKKKYHFSTAPRVPESFPCTLGAPLRSHLCTAVWMQTLVGYWFWVVFNDTVSCTNQQTARFQLPSISRHRLKGKKSHLKQSPASSG